jgi:hypothetical protein
MDARRLALAAAEVPAVPFAIPGATGEFRIQLDTSRNPLVTMMVG